MPDPVRETFSAADCLSGGGEMGALMRSLDWSRAALGPVAGWPQSLRTAVSMMLESRFAMVVAWGPQFIFLYNDRYRPVLGSTKHPAALGRAAREIFPEVWDFIGPLFEKTRRGEAVALDDVLIPLDRHGYLEDCWFTLSYSAIRDESGGVGGMLAVVAETTERVQGARRLATLRELAALASARTAEEACRNAATVLGANAADAPFALVYLYEADRKAARLAAVSGLAAGDPAAPERVLLGGGPPPAPPATLLLPMPHGYVVMGISPRCALGEAYRTFFELARDHIVAAIGAALAHEEERKRVEALAELDRAKTAFFSNVSHELRTPLTLLLGPTQDALANRDDLPEEDVRRWQLVERNGQRLLKLVNTLLDFARIEAGRIQASYEPTDLAALTADLASQFRAAIERAGLELVVECPPLPGPVFLDHEMWEKVVLNLLSNALKFTFTGRIEVRLAQRGEVVELTVRDSGIGIASGDLPSLFDRFHRVQGARARTHEGSGIGLALVRELARLHGGDVRVESELGRGSAFVVTLPLGSAHLPPDRIAAPRTLASTAIPAAPFVEEALRWSAPAEATPDHRPGTSRILLCDDNADMRQYVARILGQRFTVEAVADGQAALRAAATSPPDLVVSDIMMSGLDGFALLRALRADPGTRSVPVIFLSARAGEEARIEGLRAGADDYLVKPFSAGELLARVSTRLELARTRREAEHARERLYSQFMQAPVPVAVVVGDDLTFDFANPLYEETFGRRELAGRPLPEAFPRLGGIAQVVRDVMRSGRPFAAEDFPVPLDRGAGVEDAYVNLTCQPILDGGPEVYGVMVVALDVTEQVTARRAVEAAQRALAEQSRLNETLNRIGRVLNAGLDVEAILQHVTDEATALCRAQFGAFFFNVLNERGESYLLYTLAGVPREAFAKFPMPRNTAVFGLTFRGEGVVRSDDITADPRYGQSPPHHGMPEGHLPVRSYLAVSVVHAGEVLGGLFFGHPTPGVFNARDERVVVAVAEQAATAIRNAQLYRQARLAEARTAQLQTITAELSRAITFEDAARIMLAAMVPVLEARAASLMLVDAERQALEIVATAGPLEPETVEAMRRVPLDGSLPASEAARTGRLVWVPTRRQILDRNPELAAHVERSAVRSWGSVPLVFEGTVLGVVSFSCDEERALSPDDEVILLSAGRQCAQALERARLYDEARRSRAHAEAASQAKDEFLAMLGHELRNPLAPIQTALQLMRLRGDESLKHERTVIERQVSHVVRLVDDLLDVSRITRGNVELMREPIEIAEVVAKAIEMASPLIEERRHLLAVEVPRPGLTVNADPVRLAQVLSNLLTNAAKYTEPGGHIWVVAGREGDEVVVRVRDDGIGLDPQMLSRVFELFVQERQAIDRSQGGLGLGLAIARSLVKLHGGSVVAVSEGRGHGSELVVRLPAGDVEDDARASASPRRLASPRERPDALCVLVVDDNVDAADLLAASLRAMGHRALVAYDGAQALRLAAQASVDVALLDIGLPVMDGYELAEQLLRGAKRRPYLVAVTGYGQHSDRARSIAVGFDEHLVKPVSLDVVERLLDDVARHR